MEKRTLAIGVFGAFFSLFIFLYSFISHLDKPFGKDGDIAFAYFILEHNVKKLATLDFTDFFTTRMFYPQKNTLTFGGGMFAQTVFALPVYVATENFFPGKLVERLVFSGNIALLALSFLSFLSMYTLAFHFTKSIAGSLMAGLVYTYNPWISTQFPGYPDMIALFILPLIFLVSESVIQKVTWVNTFTLAGLFLLQLIFFVYYFLFTVTIFFVIWPIYFLFRSKNTPGANPWRFITPASIAALLFFVVIGYLYIKPYRQNEEKYKFSRSLEYVSNQSASLSDFFFTNDTNILYGGLVKNPFVKSLRAPFANVNTYEHSLFMGFTVYALLALAAVLLVKKKYNPHDKNIMKGFFLILGIAFIFSLGPYLTLGSIKLPLPYLLLYKWIPMVNVLRVPARFMVIIYLSASVLVAYVFAYFPKIKMPMLMLVFAAVILEYQHTFPSPITISPEIPKFYSWVDKQSDVRVILELPMANDLSNYPNLWRDYFDEPTYLFYALYHSKNLVNGSSSFIPPQTTQLGVRLTLHFPTPEKINELKKMGVNLLIVHVDEYPDRNLGQDVVDKLKRLGIEQPYKLGEMYAFKI